MPDWNRAVSGWHLADEWRTYVDPQDHFDAINVSIHGIDASIVEGAPRFGALANTIQHAIRGAVVVTHTTFDRLALHQAQTKCNAPPFTCTWLDSACVARRTWRELSKSGYGLSNVCKKIGYNFRHHDALEDQKASGQIMLAAMAKSDELGGLAAFAPERFATTTRIFLDMLVLPLIVRALLGEKLELLQAEIDPHVARVVPFFLAGCRNGGID